MMRQAYKYFRVHRPTERKLLLHDYQKNRTARKCYQKQWKTERKCKLNTPKTLKSFKPITKDKIKFDVHLAAVKTTKIVSVNWIEGLDFSKVLYTIIVSSDTNTKNDVQRFNIFDLFKPPWSLERLDSKHYYLTIVLPNMVQIWIHDNLRHIGFPETDKFHRCCIKLYRSWNHRWKWKILVKRSSFQKWTKPTVQQTRDYYSRNINCWPPASSQNLLKCSASSPIQVRKGSSTIRKTALHSL